MEAFAGIEAFARVVETGSFTAAAQALHSAKSSVSETVRTLEERMGVRLLDRTTRRVRPTEAGAAFYRHCRRLLDDLAQARSEAQATHKEPAGRLRIAAPDGFAERYIVPGLPAFLAAYPTIEIELIAGSEAQRLVDEGIDLAIRIAEKPEPSLVVRRIATSRVVIVATPGYLAQHGTPRKPRDIVGHRLIGFAPLAWRDTWRIGTETIAVQPRLLVNNSESLRAAALSGLGLAAIPEWLIADALAAGLVSRVLPSEETPLGGIYAVYPTNRLLTPKIRAFVDHTVRDLRSRGLSR
ncbi:LysR family transcriptional regulator [uncultured Reyranella sp.]|uniref:LysR family transcriptional regulator n=1 Tax=uncultured Reyranella sp. TaxID=735512 RepID=UPI0025FAF8BF|nr:LysR family transcriptional regulator [uncultured Reyranella sp.]